MSHSRKTNVKVINSGPNISISKAEEVSRGIESDKGNTLTGVTVISPPYPLKELRKLSSYSTILGQCITAYKRNIVGFGTSLQYNIDEANIPETPEMKNEWNFLKAVIKYFHYDKSFEDTFAQVIEHREECGNAYLEILRNGKGVPDGANNIEPEHVNISPLTAPVDVTYKRDGLTFTRRVRFRKFRQQVGTSTVWFKEFGDPRRMNWKTGDFFADDQVSTEEMEATELIHFKIGDGVYGIPDGSGN